MIRALRFELLISEEDVKNRTISGRDEEWRLMRRTLKLINLHSKNELTWHGTAAGRFLNDYTDLFHLAQRYRAKIMDKFRFGALTHSVPLNDLKDFMDKLDGNKFQFWKIVMFDHFN